PVPALPLPVAPLRIAAVAGANVQRDRRQRVDLDRDRLAAPGPQRDGGVLGMAAARAIPEVDLRPAEPPPAAVPPDPHSGVVDAIAVRLLLGQQDDGEVVEPQLAVGPPEALEASLRGAARRLWLPHRAQAPRPVAGPDPPAGVNRDLLAIDAQGAGPGPQLS